METKIYKVRKRFAVKKNIPLYFAATQVIKTEKAMYLYGHGTTETTRLGICCKCGRTLTHPVSVELGIGPVCGGHWHNWDLIGGYTPENIERLKGAMKDIKIDTWVPNSCIEDVLNCEETINIPKEHPMLNNNHKDKNEKRAEAARRVKTGEYIIKIIFPYNVDDLDKVRTLPGRKYHAEQKCWSAPLSAEVIEKLIEWNFAIDSKLQAFYDKKQAEKIHVDEVKEIEIPGLQGELYPFQKKGVAFIEAKNGRALIADEMGLGKTIQALAWLQLHPELRPVVIVTPASVKLNWEREIMHWMTNWGRIEVLSGTKPNELFEVNYKLKNANIIIINYDILDAWMSKLQGINPQVLITDESHYYKSNKAKRTKAIKKLAKSIKHVIALSGTPIVNRPVEIFNALKIIDSTIVPSFWEYAQRYCAAHYNGYGWNFTGASNTKELHEKLTNTIMMRRLKKDVLSQLPDKTYSYVPIALENENVYMKAEANFIEFVRRYKGEQAANKARSAEALAEIEALKQLAVQGKLNNIISWIQDFINNDEKLVVFAHHKFVIDALMEEFSELAVKIDGSVPTHKRLEVVDKFQNNDKIKLFVGNIKAAGIGINLTAASNVAFIELPWTPGELTQAEDRCHRIGQKNCVNVYYLLAQNTIEERIAALIDKKRKVLDAVLDGKITEQESLLTELMNEYEY